MGDAVAVPPTHRPPARQDADGAPDVPRRSPLEQYRGPPPPPRSHRDAEKAKDERGGCRPGSGCEDGSEAVSEGCLRWALDLHHLLEDQEGLQLFETFLTQEGVHDGSLSFWFACNGLRSCEDPQTKMQYMKSIYRHYIRNNLVEVSGAVRAEMTDMKTEAFDQAQREYEAFLRRTTYPRFLQSDLYVERVQRMHASRSASRTAGSHSAECSSPPSEGYSPPATASAPAAVPGVGVLQGLEILPTVREEEEESPPASLTKRNVRRMYRCSDILPRLARPTYDSPGARSANLVPNPYHVRNSYFVPPSAQDSELHSLSSGAYTDEASTDVDSIPPFKEKLSHRGNTSQNAAIRKNAAINRESLGEHAIIPRTQLEHPYSLAEKNPSQFAAAIIEKLRAVKKQADAGEKMERFHRSQMEDFPGSRPLPPLAGCGAPPAAVAAAADQPGALCERLLAVDEQSSQSILDDHVSRVFDSPLAKTPPRSTSPKRRGAMGVPMSPYAVLGHHLRHRRDRDTCSSDSGAVHDYSPEDEARTGRGGPCGRQPGVQQSGGVPSQRPRGPQLSDSGVDSGTSVVYEPLPCTAAAHDRVENWILSSKVPGMYSHPLDAERESSSRSHKKSTASGNSSRSKQNAASGVRRRASSSSQGPPGGPQWGSGCQGTPEGMLHLPGPPRLPDTMSQLVEARRRLEVTCPTSQMQQQPLSKAKKWSKGRPTISSTGQQATQTAPGDVTVIGYCFAGETVPYRRKVPGKDITLRQFKAVLGRKGNYRYFFKRSCQEFGTDVVIEEISDDNEVLPLWDGKIFATVEPVD